MIKGPRGTFDIIGNEFSLRKEVVEKMIAISGNYGFKQIETPIFEEQELFVRSVGDDSDIVNKEIYSFLDKKERKMALRPELTAPIVRSYIENKMYAQDPTAKLSYYGPAFRYERPQAGRYRQFYQFGIEAFGIKNPIFDAEIIVLANMILKQLNIEGYKILINTIGTSVERKEFNIALQSYFEINIEEMCEDCRRRIVTNPLRILDCKIDGEKDYVKNAPKLKNYLSKESIDYFEQIKESLDILDIEYTIDDNLVRGLDYYNDIVFEIVYDGGNAKNTLIGGGRYDSLVEELGNQRVEAVGFAVGIERILSVMKEQNENILENYNNSCDVYFGCENNEDRLDFLNLVTTLRENGLVCELNYNDRSYKSNLKQAIKSSAIYFITIKEENLIVKNLLTKEESIMTYQEFIDLVFS